MFASFRFEEYEYVYILFILGSEFCGINIV